MPALVDLTGNKYNKLLVLEQAGRTPAGAVKWLCQCDCGNEVLVRSGDLKSGRKSCGKCYEDITGHKYGKLTVLERVYSQKDKRYRWECQCECGEIVTQRAGDLERGRYKSCGCGKLKHGHTASYKQTVEYKTWSYMKDRCFNINNKDYKYYGGRGIVVCDRWLKSYENFYRDMGDRPKGKYSIDRIDVDGDYEPGNCRWATPVEQANNKRRHKKCQT